MRYSVDIRSEDGNSREERTFDDFGDAALYAVRLNQTHGLPVMWGPDGDSFEKADLKGDLIVVEPTGD